MEKYVVFCKEEEGGGDGCFEVVEKVVKVGLLFFKLLGKVEIVKNFLVGFVW